MAADWMAAERSPVTYYTSPSPSPTRNSDSDPKVQLLPMTTGSIHSPGPRGNARCKKRDYDEMIHACASFAGELAVAADSPTDAIAPVRETVSLEGLEQPAAIVEEWRRQMRQIPGSFGEAILQGFHRH